MSDREVSSTVTEEGKKEEKKGNVSGNGHGSCTAPGIIGIASHQEQPLSVVGPGLEWLKVILRSCSCIGDWR
jgi:hypothetical protein